MAHAAEVYAFVIYLGTFIPCFNILQLSYRSQWALSNQDSHLHPQLHFSLPVIEKNEFPSFRYRKFSASLLFSSGYGNNCVLFRKRTKYLAKVILKTVGPVFELLFWEPDPRETEFNSFLVPAVFGSGSKGLFFILLLMLHHSQTAKQKRTKFMHLALNIEWDLN